MILKKGKNIQKHQPYPTPSLEPGTLSMLHFCDLPEYLYGPTPALTPGITTFTSSSSSPEPTPTHSSSSAAPGSTTFNLLYAYITRTTGFPIFSIILPSFSSLSRSGIFFSFEKRASFLENPVSTAYFSSFSYYYWPKGGGRGMNCQTEKSYNRQGNFLW